MAHFQLGIKRIETLRKNTTHMQFISKKKEKKVAKINVGAKATIRRPKISCKEAARREWIDKSFQCSLIGGRLGLD